MNGKLFDIRQRQAESIAAARARGVRWGNKTKCFPPDFNELYHLWKNNIMDMGTLMERCDMKRTAFRKHLKEYESALAATSEAQ